VALFVVVFFSSILTISYHRYPFVCVCHVSFLNRLQHSILSTCGQEYRRQPGTSPSQAQSLSHRVDCMAFVGLAVDKAQPTTMHSLSLFLYLVYPGPQPRYPATYSKVSKSVPIAVQSALKI